MADKGLELINRLEVLGLRDAQLDSVDPSRVSITTESLAKLLRRVEASLKIDYDKEPSLPLRNDQWESTIRAGSGKPPDEDPDRPWWLLQVVPTDVKSWPGEPLQAQAVCLWVRRRH